MLLKWIGFVLLSAGGIFLFQWLFYQGVNELYRTRTITFVIPYIKTFSWHFVSIFFLYFAWSAIVSAVMVIPNAFVFSLSAISYHEWFKKAWILYLTLSAINVGCNAFIIWYKFGEAPSKGALVGLLFYSLGAIISAIYK